MRGEVLELENVTKHLKDVTPVRSVSLTITRGSLHGCLGLHGVGRPTTMRRICDSIDPMQSIRHFYA